MPVVGTVAQHMIAFGSLEIDSDLRQIRYRGREIPTQPLVFDLLHYLASRSGVVVSKDDLVRDVWKGAAVSDSAISQAISLLRRTLRASVGSSVLVRTVWGHGYRFVASSQRLNPDQSRAATDTEHDSAGLLLDRTRELAALNAALRDAEAGRGSVAIVSGEPGIGKTRLIKEATGDAYALSHHVFWVTGRQGDASPSYRPWRQLLRACARDLDSSTLREPSGEAAEYLSWIVPELVHAAATDTDVEPQAVSRLALVDAVTALLSRVAADHPLVVVFDDAHAADSASLHMLAHVARAAYTMPLLVIIAHRDAEARRRPDVARIVGELAGDATNIRLRGIGDDGVARLVADSVDRSSAADVVATLQAWTAGNPFLLEEAVNALATTNGSARTPTTPRRLKLSVGAAAFIAQRLDLLSPSTRELLRVAALMGEAFSLRELAAACDQSDEVVLADLREAVDDGVLVADSLADTRLRFRSGYFREALESELSDAARAELHYDIGDAIERLNRPHLETRIESLAYHFLRGAAHGDRRRAIDYAEAAAARAMKRFGYDDAGAYLEAALDLFDNEQMDDEPRRCEILLALGSCRQKVDGLESARRIFGLAAQLARELGRPDLLARSALGFAPWTSYGDAGDVGVHHLEEALAALPSKASALKAALLARLAHALDGTAGTHTPRDRITGLAKQAVRMARRSADLPTLGRALFAARWVDWHPATFASRRTRIRELMSVSEKLDSSEIAVIGEGWRVADALEVGDPTSLDDAMRRHAALATQLRETEHLWWSAVWRAMRALMEGRLAQSEDLVGRALEIGRRVYPDNACLVAHVQECQLHADRGLLERALGDLEGAVNKRPAELEADATVHCRKARLLAGLGRLVEARRELEYVAHDDFGMLAPDMKYSDNLAALAVTCAALDDRVRARAIYRRLKAAGGRNLVFGPGLLAAGPAALYRGVLAGVLGHHHLAKRQFSSALAMSRRMGWVPLAAETQYQYASALLRRGRRDDRATATRLLDDAERAADALGLGRLASAIGSRRAECSLS